MEGRSTTHNSIATHIVIKYILELYYVELKIGRSIISSSCEE